MPHYDITNESGTVVLEMELSDGGTLKQPMEPSEADKLAEDLRFVAHAARQTLEAPVE